MREEEAMYAEERKKRTHPSRVCINFEEFKDHPPHLKLSIDLKLRPYLGTPQRRASFSGSEEWGFQAERF